MRLILLHVIIPIIIGGFLYLFYSPSQLIFFKWIAMVQLENILLSIREIAGKGIGLLPKWIINYAPDILWAYSFTSALIITNFSGSQFKILFFIPFILGLILEILQSNNFIAGTGDFFDVFAYFSGTFLSIYILKPTK